MANAVPDHRSPLVHLTRKYSGFRGLLTSLGVLTVFLFGWYWQSLRWLGILFVSLPILIIFLFTLDRLAQVILPAADPDNLAGEQWPKTRAFIAYMTGIQYPVWMARSKRTANLKCAFRAAPLIKSVNPASCGPGPIR